MLLFCLFDLPLVPVGFKEEMVQHAFSFHHLVRMEAEKLVGIIKHNWLVPDAINDESTHSTLLFTLLLAFLL